MSNLAIYNEKKQNLSEIGFVKDTFDQIKIKNINDSYELGKKISIILTEFYNRSGVKGEITEFQAKDIKEMIMQRFKTLSLDEVAYAFKMERYGLFGDRTEHFQQFDASYIATILDKWKSYKQKVKTEHNISRQKSEKEISEEEKQFWINKGVTTCIDHFLETKTIKNGYIYIYDILYEEGYLPKSKEEKLKVKNAAIELIEMECKEKKPVSLDEKREIDYVLSQILEPKSAIVVNKCKELSIINFFRKLVREEKVDEFKSKYSNQ